MDEIQGLPGDISRHIQQALSEFDASLNPIQSDRVFRQQQLLFMCLFVYLFVCLINAFACLFLIAFVFVCLFVYLVEALDLEDEVQLLEKPQQQRPHFRS